MKLEEYIDKVVKKREEIFCKLTIGKNFNWNNLIKLCDLTLSRECLIVTWSLIIDLIAETYKDEKIILFIPEKVLFFLIENNICLMDLAHLKLPTIYLHKIYEKDNSCWEALKTIESFDRC